MSVYIEDIIIDNLIINYMILFFSAKLTKNPHKKINLFLSALFGTICVLGYVFFNLSDLFLIIYKIFIAIFMIIIAFKFISIKQYFLNLLNFILITIIMGGLCMAISLSLNNFSLVNGIFYYNLSLPMGVIIGLGFLICQLFYNLFIAFKQKQIKTKFVYNVTLNNKNISLKLTGFLDSGNTLIDPTNNKPVYILSLKNFRKIFGITLDDILIGNLKILENKHYINAKSVNTSNKILVATLKSMSVEISGKTEIFNDVNIGLSFQDFEKKLSCGIILSPQIFNKENLC